MERKGNMEIKISSYLGKSTVDRFWEKVLKRKTGCWEWTGNISRGYGFIWVNKKNFLAHIELAQKFNISRGSIRGISRNLIWR